MQFTGHGWYKFLFLALADGSVGYGETCHKLIPIANQFGSGATALQILLFEQTIVD
jgi:hypothetical protein